MTNHTFPENGIRCYLPTIKKMITSDRGYQIVVPMSGKSQTYAGTISDRQSIEPTIYMHKLSDHPALYESDILSFDAGFGPETGLVSWSEARYCYIVQSPEREYPLSSVTSYEVIGNYYENPELLRVAAKKEEAPANSMKENPKLITIYLTAYEGGSWSYTASCAGRTKKEEGIFPGRDAKYTLLWSCVKALSSMKENFEIQLFTENENFNALLNSGRIRKIEQDGWMVDGRPIPMAEGYKRLSTEMKKFTNFTALAL